MRIFNCYPIGGDYYQGFGDGTIKMTMEQAIDSLHNHGVGYYMITSDDVKTEIGIYRAHLSGKLERLKSKHCEYTEYELIFDAETE